GYSFDQQSFRCARQWSEALATKRNRTGSRWIHTKSPLARWRYSSWSESQRLHSGHPQEEKTGSNSDGLDRQAEESEIGGAGIVGAGFTQDPRLPGSPEAARCSGEDAGG